MTKADLAELIYERVGFSKKEAGEMVEAVFAIIKDCLRRREQVKISSFGSFVINHKRARRGRNPQTGAAIQIAASRVAKCSPAKAVKDRLNGVS